MWKAGILHSLLKTGVVKDNESPFCVDDCIIPFWSRIYVGRELIEFGDRDGEK
jgi:hypothetical protein